MDLLRLVAAFQMIHGHTIGGLLSPRYSGGGVHDAWQFTRGLTSVSFLFAAGFALYWASVGRIAAYLADEAAKRKRLRRAFTLLAIGYLLRIPNPFLHGLAFQQTVRDWMLVDVLQCIGVTLLIVEILVRALRKTRRVVLVASVLGALAIVAAKPIDSSVASLTTGWGRPFANYLSAAGGSLFPLVPWSGFMLLGIGVAHFAFGNVRSTGSMAAWWASLRAASARLLGLGATSVAVGYLVADASIALSMKRLGTVLAISSALGLLTVVLRIERLPRTAEDLAQATLALYVVHLQLLYFAGFGLVRTIGPALSLPVALALAALVEVITFSLVLAWIRFQRQRAASSLGKTG